MKFYLFIVILLLFGQLAFAQSASTPEEGELENFIIFTDQDSYLSGNRIWFVGKMLKNHESFRYSKLAYISLLDHSGKVVHHEKMLLSNQDLIFGDIFLPENTPSGVYSLNVYTKWMSGFQDFPIAQRNFLVLNPNSPQVGGKASVLIQKNPFQQDAMTLIHTAKDPQLIEIQDERGITIQILEAVQPLQKVQISLNEGERSRIVFQDKSYSVPKSDWIFDPVKYELRTKKGIGIGHRLITSTPWDILESRQSEDGVFRLDKSNYQHLRFFDMSIVDASGHLVWTYQVKNPILGSGQIGMASKGKVGDLQKLEFERVERASKNAVILAKAPEDHLISELVDLLNDPNWVVLGEQENFNSLPVAAQTRKESEPSLKEYSPMFSYSPWSTPEAETFRTAFLPKTYSLSIPEEILLSKVNRKIYREYFEIEEEVVELESPFAPDKIYYLEDYEEFDSFENFLKQIVPQVKLKKAKGEEGKVIWLANTDNQQVKFDKVPKVLIDFYTVDNLQELWSLDMSTIHRLEVYYHRQTVQNTNLGPKAGDGLVLIYTKNNEYGLKKSLPRSRYFLADVQVPRRPSTAHENPQKVSGNAIQLLQPGIEFYRGKAQTIQWKFDTAGDWKIEAWVFGNDTYSRFEKSITIDP